MGGGLIGFAGEAARWSGPVGWTRTVGFVWGKTTRLYLPDFICLTPGFAVKNGFVRQIFQRNCPGNEADPSNVLILLDRCGREGRPAVASFVGFGWPGGTAGRWMRGLAAGRCFILFCAGGGAKQGQRGSIVLNSKEKNIETV